MTHSAPTRIWLRVVAIVLGVVWIWVWTTVSTPSVTLGEVTYQLRWDHTNTTAAPDGSVTLTTDLGYQVTIAEATLTTYSASLTSCPHFHGLLDRVLGLMAPTLAWAGHGDAEDPTAVTGPAVESVLDSEAAVLGTAIVHEPSYCDGFTNWGAGNAIGASGEPEPTLVILGSWTAPDDPTEHDLTLTTDTNWGTSSSLQDPEGSAVYAETTDGPVTVEIVRSLATAFDGIDFATADEADIAIAILRNLAGSTRFVVTEGTVHQV